MKFIYYLLFQLFFFHILYNLCQVKYRQHFVDGGVYCKSLIIPIFEKKYTK